MLNLDISPILLAFGPFQIRYYGIIYVLGFLIGLFVLLKASKKGKINLDKDQIYNLIFYLIIGVLIGSRIFHIIFWNLTYYLANPIQVFYIWQGGLSFHGGLVGAVLATYLFTKKNNINLMRLADILTLPAIFILALGRVANFINQEILGTITQVSWCVKFLSSIDPNNCRHPVQLYAAAGRLATFFILLKFPKPKKDGFIFWNFVFLFGLGRTFLDFIREDLRYLGLSSGQYLSILMVLIAGYALIKHYKEDLRNIFKSSKDETPSN